MILTRDGFYPLSLLLCTGTVAVLLCIRYGVVRVTQLAIQATTVIPLRIYLFDLFKQHVKN